jgi:hypothetical protein
MFMMRLLHIACIGCAVAQTFDYAQFVNPFIGSEGAIPGYACEPISEFILISTDNH